MSKNMKRPVGAPPQPPAPITFKPIFQKRIWGGRRIAGLFHKELPARAVIGESWEISDRPDAASRVEKPHHFGRKNLRQLMDSIPDALLGACQTLNGRFPLLVKILDASDDLSVQVHPPAAKAAALKGEPKTEIWHVIDAEPGAELYAGLKKGVTRGEFEKHLKAGSVAECLHRIKVKAGDTLFLPSGRVHALGKGIVIFEIQQNSDTTFRVFDWNRVDAATGKPRELHVKESLECIDFDDFTPRLAGSKAIAHGPGVTQKELLRNDLFDLDLLELQEGCGIGVWLPRCAVVGVVSGEIRLRWSGGKMDLNPGQFALLPANLRFAWLGAREDSKFLIARPG